MKNEIKSIWWNVTMAWGPPENDEGTYSDSFLAPDYDAAKRLCAEAMADSGEKEFEDGEERKRFIECRMDGDADVYRTDDQFRQDFNKLFGDMLFGNGPEVAIDLDKLGEILVANRDAILVRPEDIQRPHA